MRYLTLLLLLLAAPLGAQESDRQIRQRLGWTLSQARSAATAQTAAAAHIQAAYDAINARIVRDSIAALTPLPPVEPPPAPVDTVPSPPPPPVDTAVTPVPAPPAGLLTYGNLPAGMTVRTEARWNVVPGGWFVRDRTATARVRTEASSPTGGVLEFHYPAGFPDGTEPGVAWWSGFGAATEVFIGTTMRYTPGWRPHSNQVKLHLINLGSYGWIGMFDGCRGKAPGHWTMAMWGAQAVAWPREGDCMTNTAPLPAYAPGSWVKHEIYLNRTAGIIRVWVNGVMTLDATGLRFPADLRFGEFQHAGTWGGGGSAVQVDQFWEIAATTIGSR
jgi:hypothetical protein